MAKSMVFIDGSWLYASNSLLAESFGGDFQIDFGKLPHALAEEVGAQLGRAELDVVRTYLFGSYPSNYDLRDEQMAQKQLDFYSLLKEEYHYEVEIFPMNFGGRRIRKRDRDLNDNFQPVEKCVDVSLATYMLYFAAIPYAYDIAIAVLGDRDFKPMLQYVRRLGKRVAIASIKGSCAPELADTRDEARVKDFDVIWLNHLLDRIELKYTPHQLECQSPVHKGDRMVWTTYHPRKGHKFYCDDCKAVFAAEKQEAQNQFVSSETDEASDGYAEQANNIGVSLSGKIIKKIEDKGYGFISANDNNDYFFHFTDLAGDIEYQDTHEGMDVQFEIKRKPAGGKAGAAQNVRSPEE
jgi:cold shock CspA family protein/uncharacterized LabA/DUF88 family protein